MADRVKVNDKGLYASEGGYQFGSGRRPYAKWRMLDPLVTGARTTPTIFTGDAYAVRISCENCAAGDEVQIKGQSWQGPGDTLPLYDIGAQLADDIPVYLTAIPETLAIEKVAGTAAVRVIVDVYYGPTQR